MVALRPVVIAILLASTASAQELDQGFGLERFRAASDSAGVLDVEWAAARPHLTWDLALMMGYSDDPLVVYGDDSRRLGSLVKHRLGGALSGSVGIWDRAQIGFDLGLVLSQQGQYVDGVGGGGLAGSGAGDLRLAAKLQLLQAARYGVDVAIAPAVLAPTSGPDSYLGEQALQFVPDIAVSRELHGLRLAATLGYRMRSHVQLLDLRIEDELALHLGAGFRLEAIGGPPLELDATAALATSAARPLRSSNQNAAEWLLGGSYVVDSSVQAFAALGMGVLQGFGTPDWRAVAGVRIAMTPPPVAAEACDVADRDGDGRFDGDDRCPDVPETFNDFDDADGCPDHIPDTDGDGLNDRLDACVTQPEDVDGFDDADGCPDPDDDKDGLVDARDRCPRLPGIVLLEGCPGGEDLAFRAPPDAVVAPEPAGQQVRIGKARLELGGQVYFDTDSATIQSRSFPLLDNVARVIVAHSELERLQIEGHTDDRGNDAANLSLSQRRAESVARYLTEKGVAAYRLAARGFGEIRPVESNGNEAGRALNRRVEFMVVQVAGTP